MVWVSAIIIIIIIIIVIIIIIGRLKSFYYINVESPFQTKMHDALIWKSTSVYFRCWSGWLDVRTWTCASYLRSTEETGGAALLRLMCVQQRSITRRSMFAAARGSTLKPQHPYLFVCLFVFWVLKQSLILHHRRRYASVTVRLISVSSRLICLCAWMKSFHGTYAVFLYVCVCVCVCVRSSCGYQVRHTHTHAHTPVNKIRDRAHIISPLPSSSLSLCLRHSGFSADRIQVLFHFQKKTKT